ncbi:MAG: hypothetical protein WCE23_03310 [Candidatus Binatus sp.]|uniref:hypothetical protein n=1 Tax=Candidatus Binatus sp. TaxID=2811406 RepID=UPI003C745423
MTEKPSRRVPDESAATREEIEEAIEALTPADTARLRRYAQQRILRLGRTAESRTADDLMQTALIDLLKDTRRWNKNKVGFVRFLIGAMQSISSNWARSYDDEESAVLESDLRKQNEQGKVFSPLDTLRAQTPDPEKQLSDGQTLKLIEDLFKDDEKAQMVLTAWQEGFDPSGVRELWDLSQNDYNTIVRRIRRKLDTARVFADHEPGSK